MKAVVTRNALIKGVLFVYNKTHWFTDKEAWAVYRLFAFIEALGWILLVSAIIYRSFDMPGYEIAIGIAGRLHGVFFLLYFVFVLLTARSMEWGFWRLSGALLAGMPPFTSVIYERLMAHDRRKNPVIVAPPKNLD